MNATTVLRAFKPNTTLFGYASFLAVNAAGAWGGVFPFLPMKLQEPQTLFWFFLVQSLVFAACFFLSVVGSYHLPGPTRLFIVRLSAVPYLLGWFCLIGAMYLDAWTLPLVIAGGGFIGVGSAGFYMLWQRLFASQDSDAGNHDLILGTAYASVLYFALHLIPRAVTVYLIPLVITPFFALAISLKSREINFDQPMFEDVPKKNRGVYRQAISTLARPALCVGSLGLCAGLIRALAIDDPAIGSLVNALSMGASLVTAVAFMVLWQFKSVRLNVVSLFRIVFPVIITGFVLLPFLGDVYARWLAAVLYAAYSVTIMLMMIQCAQSSRDHGRTPCSCTGSSAAWCTPCTMQGSSAERLRDRWPFRGCRRTLWLRSAPGTCWDSCTSSARAASIAPCAAHIDRFRTSSSCHWDRRPTVPQSEREPSDQLANMPMASLFTRTASPSRRPASARSSA